MKTDKVGLTRLISALGRPPQQQQLKQEAAQQQAAKPRPQDTDAVKIAVGFGRGTRPPEVVADDAVRPDKIAQLKKRIDSGEFNPSSEAVAVAVIKDLGI